MADDAADAVRRSKPLTLDGKAPRSDNIQSEPSKLRPMPGGIPAKQRDWLQDYKKSRPGMRFPRKVQLPDMEEVQKDVSTIVTKIDSIDIDSPKKGSVDKGIDDVKRSVAGVINILETARFDLTARDKGYFTKDINKLSVEIKRIVKDIDRLERSYESRSEAPVDMEEIRREVQDIQKSSENIMTQVQERKGQTSSSPEFGTIDAETGMKERKVWRIGNFELEPPTARMVKRYIPFAFTILAVAAYIIVFSRVIFGAPISSILPLSIHPNQIFILLAIILCITVIANIIQRQKIKYAQRNASPIWHKGSEDQ